MFERIWTDIVSVSYVQFRLESFHLSITLLCTYQAKSQDSPIQLKQLEVTGIVCYFDS